MYPRNSLAPFSAPHRVAVSTSQPPSPHSPYAAQLLSLDCVACISLGCEQHLGTTATSSHQQQAAPNFQRTWLLVSPPELPAPHAPQPKFASHQAPPTSVALSHLLCTLFSTFCGLNVLLSFPNMGTKIVNFQLVCLIICIEG